MDKIRLNEVTRAVKYKYTSMDAAIAKNYLYNRLKELTVLTKKDKQAIETITEFISYHNAHFELKDEELDEDTKRYLKENAHRMV